MVRLLGIVGLKKERPLRPLLIELSETESGADALLGLAFGE